MNMLTVEREAAASREVTVIRNLQAAEVSLDALYRDVTMAQR